MWNSIASVLLILNSYIFLFLFVQSYKNINIISFVSASPARLQPDGPPGIAQMPIWPVLLCFWSCRKEQFVVQTLIRGKQSSFSIERLRPAVLFKASLPQTTTCKEELLPPVEKVDKEVFWKFAQEETCVSKETINIYFCLLYTSPSPRD